MDAKMSGQKIKEKKDINSLKVSTQIYLPVKKEKNSNCTVEETGGHHLNQEIKINITRNTSCDISSGIFDMMQ